MGSEDEGEETEKGLLSGGAPLLDSKSVSSDRDSDYLRSEHEPLNNRFSTREQGNKRAFGQVVVGGFFTNQLFAFRPNEMRFLREFGPDISVEDAAKKAGVPVDFANRMLRRKAVKEFLTDKFQQVALQNGWTVERWFAEGDKVWRGQKMVTREQLDIWKEFGARILPKSRGAAVGDGSEKPQITININAVDEAFKRQKAIEAEILDAEHGTR